MGKGIEMARGDAPLHAGLLDDLKDQLLIVFLKRLGGSITLPVAEVDDTGSDMLALSFDADARTFHFETRKKQ